VTQMQKAIGAGREAKDRSRVHEFI
jgi:hypothetical protein